MRTAALLLLSPAACLLAACSPQSAPPPPQTSATTVAGAAPQAVEGPVEAPPPLPQPAPEQTIYVVWVKDEQGRPVVGARTMLLTEAPDALYMREPIRQTVVSTYKTPRHGRVHHIFPREGGQPDGKPKYLWIGSAGFDPFVVELEPAVGGKTYERTVTVKILPVATLVIKDHEGNRVREAIVTIKKHSAESNVGNTYRSNDFGELQVSKVPGTYHFQASRPDGSCLLTQNWEWNGDPAPVEIRLPPRKP